VVTAGRALTCRGCYGAFLGREIDGSEPEAIVRAVAEEVEAGATVIKLMLTGGVDFATGRVGQPHFDADQVRATVGAAHARGATVAAHANGAAAVRLAAEAGVDSVEHGILAGERELSLLAERGTRWVPTLTPLFRLQGTPAWPKLPALLAAHMTAVGRGRDLGVAIVAGTDSGSPGVAHNSIATELWLLAQAGLRPDEVAASATHEAARLLGLSDGYGTLSPGAHTDMSWFSRDPFAGLDGPDPVDGPVLPALGWVREGWLGDGSPGFNVL
jgi:imidazolonepropionase-like amidohydrolase